MLKVKVIVGSTREGRQGEKVGKYVMSLAKQESNWEVELLDLKELNLPTFNEAVSPSMGGVSTDPAVVKWAEKIAEADAYIFVTTEYNHGYTAPLKNAIDWLYKEWQRKPAAFVSYGGWVGGARAVEQLRQVFAELHMTAVRDQVFIPFVWEAFGEDGQPHDTKLADRAKTMFADLTWWAEALKAARNK